MQGMYIKNSPLLQPEGDNLYLFVHCMLFHGKVSSSLAWLQTTDDLTSQAPAASTFGVLGL